MWKLARLGTAALLVFLGACHHNPPNPIPSPTPPTPSPSPTPTTGPVATGMLARTTADAKLTDLAGHRLDLFFCSRCCPDPAPERWPLMGTGLMDSFGSYGCNAVEFRMGPFSSDLETTWSDTGGAYNQDGSFNERFFSEVDKLVQHAIEKKTYVFMVVVDTWYCKHAAWGEFEMPWGAEATQACGHTPHPKIEEWVRYLVRRYNRFGNVIWVLDNEGSLIQGAKRDFFAWERDTIRDEETKEGSGNVHIIGTNTEWTDLADFVALHDRAPLTSPRDGRWTINSERNPNFPPEQEASNFKLARDQGLCYGFWASEMAQSDVDKTLGLFRDVVQGTAHTGCFPPPSDDPLWAPPSTPETPPLLPSQWPSQMLPAVRAAVEELGDRCGQSQIESLDQLGQKLRLQGYCADRSADGLFIRAPGSYQGHPVFEEMHPYAALPNGCATLNQTYKGAWWYTGTLPDPAPSPSACGSPTPPPLARFAVKEHTKGPNWTTLDSTPLVHDKDYCATIGYTDGRVECSVRLEGDPSRSACETLVVGTPQWSMVVDAGGTPGHVSEENPYMYLVPRGTSGVATVCGQNGVCGSTGVTK